MRFVFKAIAVGILIGAALFFVPFIFGFVFFVLFAFIIMRLVAGPRRYGYWRSGFHGRHHFAHSHDDFYGNDVVPIDGGRYNSSMNRGGPETQFPVQ